MLQVLWSMRLAIKIHPITKIVRLLWVASLKVRSHSAVVVFCLLRLRDGVLECLANRIWSNPMYDTFSITWTITFLWASGSVGTVYFSNNVYLAVHIKATSAWFKQFRQFSSVWRCGFEATVNECLHIFFISCSSELDPLPTEALNDFSHHLIQLYGNMGFPIFK